MREKVIEAVGKARKRAFPYGNLKTKNTLIDRYRHNQLRKACEANSKKRGWFDIKIPRIQITCTSAATAWERASARKDHSGRW